MLGAPHHVDLTVSDINAAIEFYDRILTRLGYQRSGWYSGGAPCWIHQAPRAVFSMALQQARSGTPPHDRYAPGLHHLAFAADSREAVNEFYRFLQANGVEILDAPAEYPYTPGYYAVFFADPDGIKLELVHEPSPEAPDDRADKAED